MVLRRSDRDGLGALAASVHGKYVKLDDYPVTTVGVSAQDRIDGFRGKIGHNWVQPPEQESADYPQGSVCHSC